MNNVLILLPVYNDANRVARTISSIISQSYQEWDLCILDNNSDDGTFEVCLSFAYDERIHVFRNDELIPLNQNWIKVYEIGKEIKDFCYISFIASDDYWDSPDYLKCIIESFDTGSENSLFLSPIHICFSDNFESHELTISPEATSCSRFLRKIRILRNWNYVHAIYGVYTKELFGKLMTDRFSKLSSYMGSDWYWVYNLLHHSKIRVVKNARYSYCIDRRSPSPVLPTKRNFLDMIKFPYRHFYTQLYRFWPFRILDVFIIFTWVNYFLIKSLLISKTSRKIFGNVVNLKPKLFS